MKNHNQATFEDLYTDLLKKGSVDPGMIRVISDWIKNEGEMQ